MTSKGISKLRKKYSHVNSMEPRQLKVFEKLSVYRKLKLKTIMKNLKGTFNK